MSFFGTLSEKPWIPIAPGYDTVVDEDQRYLIGKTALKFFMAVVVVIFFLFIITFISRTQYPDFRALAGEPWQPLTNPVQLWLNTVALICAGVAMHWAKWNANKQHINRTIIGMVAGAFFTLLFLIGQVYVWQQLNQLGYFFNSNPANSYYYLFTSIHALHLIGGFVAFTYITVRYIRNHSLAKLTTGISLCTIYWDLLLLIWLALFALLTSSSETFNTIAVLCGF